MNGILKTKYKLHRFINIAFYLIFFIIGYFVGNGFNLENIKNIISNFFSL